MFGKKKCKILKDIRQQIAQDNNIPLESPECNHQGDCSGTCPKCEEEVQYLERLINPEYPAPYYTDFDPSLCGDVLMGYIQPDFDEKDNLFDISDM